MDALAEMFIYYFFTSLIASGPRRIVSIALASVCIMSPTRLWSECVGQPVFVSGLYKDCASDIWHFSATGITILCRKLHFRRGILELLCVWNTPGIELATVWRIRACGKKTNLVTWVGILIQFSIVSDDVHIDQKKKMNVATQSC